MKTVKRFIAIIAISLSGCVTVDKSILLDRSAYPVPMNTVQALIETDTVPEDCQRVAMLHAEGPDIWTKQTFGISCAKKRDCLGATQFSSCLRKARTGPSGSSVTIQTLMLPRSHFGARAFFDSLLGHLSFTGKSHADRGLI